MTYGLMGFGGRQGSAAPLAMPRPEQHRTLHGRGEPKGEREERGGGGRLGPSKNAWGVHPLAPSWAQRARAPRFWGDGMYSFARPAPPACACLLSREGAGAARGCHAAARRRRRVRALLLCGAARAGGRGGRPRRAAAAGVRPRFNAARGGAARLRRGVRRAARHAPRAVARRPPRPAAAAACAASGGGHESMPGLSHSIINWSSRNLDMVTPEFCVVMPCSTPSVCTMRT
jgi:hypothetical protein